MKIPRPVPLLSAILSALVALYGIVGFLVLPPILKPRIIEAIVTSTHRDVALGDVAVNPYTLSLTLRDFRIKDPDGEALAGWDELYLNFEMRSLFHQAYMFSEISATAPFISVRILSDGRLSVHDLLEGKQQRGDTVESPPLQLVIDLFAIRQGRFTYENRARATPHLTRLDSLDLTLENFTTAPDREGLYEFEASTPQQEKLHWHGSLSTFPVRSSGMLELRGIQGRTLWQFLAEMFRFEVAEGQLDTKAEYELDLSRDTTVFRLRNGSINATAFRLRDRGHDMDAVSFDRLDVGGMEVAYPERTVHIGQILSRDGRMNAFYDTTGYFSLEDLFLPLPDSTAPEPPEDTGWKVTIGKVSATAYTFELEDRSLDPPTTTRLAPVSVTLEDFRYGLPGAARIRGETGVNDEGSAKVAGTLMMEPRAIALDVELVKIGLRPFQPYAAQAAKILLESGTFSLRGKTRYTQRGSASAITFQGNCAVESLRIIDPKLKEDFLRWDRLDVRAVDYSTTPARLTIGEIVGTRPYARFIIGPDRITNVQHIMGRDTVSATMAATPTPGTQEKQTPKRIGLVKVADGTLNFSDFSLTPNFSISIDDMNGTIKGLSSEELSRAEVDLAGGVDKYAPALIRGRINPLSERAFTDILMQFKGIELTSFTGYAGKFAGYKIDKGKLNLDLHYTLNSDTLIGENKIIIDQLTLGAPVEGPDVTSLPVKLAIALLKDANGVIDLDVPVSGNLNDPEFSLWPVIWKAFLNLIVKAVTAPFALIGSLFGGASGEELNHVDFSPGADTLSQSELLKLENLAKALTERPALRMGIRGTSSDSLDRPALAERALMKNVRTPGFLPWEPLSEDERQRLLGLYRRTFNDDPAKLIQDSAGIEADMEPQRREAAILEAARARLVAGTTIPEEELVLLARRRADTIKAYFVLRNGIPEARVFLLDVDARSIPAGGSVPTLLSLESM